MKNGTKMGSGAHSGPEGSQGRKKVPKIVWIWFGLGSFLAPCLCLEAFWGGVMFCCFFGRRLFRSLGDFWVPKVPKRAPKWSQNGAQSEPRGTSRTLQEV